MNSFRESVFQVSALVFAAIFFFGIFTLNWLGYVTRKRIARLHPDKDVGLGTSEGSLIGLMALLLAFSFNMAATKYESRRQTVIEEANLLNAGIQRCYLYPDSVRQNYLRIYKKYLAARINYFDVGDKPEKIQAALEEADKQLTSIWKYTILLNTHAENRIRSEQMAQVLISLKNIMRTREAARVAVIPTLIIVVLLLLVALASFLTGFGVKPGNRSVLLSLIFALMTAVVLYVIMELSRPRQGVINLSSAEQNIVDLRKLFP